MRSVAPSATSIVQGAEESGSSAGAVPTVEFAAEPPSARRPTVDTEAAAAGGAMLTGASPTSSVGAFCLAHPRRSTTASHVILILPAFPLSARHPPHLRLEGCPGR